MKIIYCSRKENIDILKDTPTAHKTSKIKVKFTESKYIRNLDFRSVSNIEYMEFDEKPDYSDIYDSLMRKQLFEHNFHNLDHKAIYDKYVEFNKKMADEINERLEEDDLIIINDSSLYLIPSLVQARVVVRNITFDRCFIEKIPFYSEIINSLLIAQKFFDSDESLNSFNSFMCFSFEFSTREKGGCWFIKPHIDKFTVLDTLEKIRNESIEKHNNPEVKENSYLKFFNFPKRDKVILTDSNLLHLEPFIKENPDVQIRYLRSSIEFNEEFSRMIQYLKKTYLCKISIGDPVEYSHIVAEIFFCDVYVGRKYVELAKFFGRAVINPDFDSYRLKEKVFNSLRSKKSERYDIPGEEEYLMEFLRVNGYELVIEKDNSIDERIEYLILELEKSIINPKTREYFEKRLNNGSKEYYAKKEEIIVEPKKISCNPLIVGDGSYSQLKKKRLPKELKPIDINKLKEFWKNSNKKILLDYDGTLTPIVNDPDKAFPPENLKEILLRLNSKGKVVVCSGRSKIKLDEWIPKEIEVYSEHGAFNRINGEWKSVFKSLDLVNEIEKIMKYYSERTPGTHVERKETGVVFHFREADKCFNESRLYSELRRIGGENVVLIKKGIEYRSGSKKQVILKFDPAICAGDDVVDEEMFADCNGISIKVGKGKSFANGCVEGVPSFINLLDILSRIE